MVISCRTYQKGDRSQVARRDGDDMGDGEFDEEDGPTWTILVDERPVSLFGFAYCNTGVYDMWGVGSDEVRGHPVYLIRMFRRTILLAFEKLDIHRIQATCRTDKPEYARFLRLLGFQEEGVLRQMTPDRSDLRIFSRLED